MTAVPSSPPRWRVRGAGVVAGERSRVMVGAYGLRRPRGGLPAAAEHDGGYAAGADGAWSATGTNVGGASGDADGADGRRGASPGTDLGGADLGGALEALGGAIDGLAATDLALVDPAELPGLVKTLSRSVTRVQALTARAVAMMERRGAHEADGHSSTKSWLTDELKADPAEATKQTRRARNLDAHPDLSDAFAAGDIGENHVDIIDRAIRHRDDGEDPDRLEKELLDAAKQMSPRELARYTRRRQIENEPERAEQREAALYARRNLRYVEQDHGGAQCIIDLTPADYELHRSATTALMTKDPADLPPDQKRSYGQRMYDAVMEQARRTLAHAPDVKTRNGTPMTGTVIVDWATLAGESSHAAELGFAGPVTAETARRLLCDAQIARVLKAGASQILDVGRTQRTATASQARALLSIWKGCARCGAPPSFCEMHHIEWWDRDLGATDLANLLPLCWSCHTAVHTTGLVIEINADGTVTFVAASGTHHHRAPP